MDIEKIVSLVINGDFKIDILRHTEGRKFTRDETVKLEEPEKELKSVMTDFIVYEFLNSNKQVCKFITAVYNTFNDSIRLYNRRTKHSDNDIFFIYKGGNILRFVSNKIFYMLPGKVKDDLIAYYKDSFKKSDADFTIYINPKLSDFDKVFSDITNLAYLLQNHLRNIFLENPGEYFNFYNLTESSKMELLNTYLDKLNDTELVKSRPVEEKYFSLSLPSSSYNAKQSLQVYNKYISKPDFEIVFDKKANILYTKNPTDTGKISQLSRYTLKPIHLQHFTNRQLIELSNKQLNIYGNIFQSEFIISANHTTTFVVHGGLVSFNLVRTKISFNAKKTVDNVDIVDKVDGELIDVSIANRGDYLLEKFFKGNHKYITEYKLEEDDCAVSFRAYSIEYLIRDLENILFVQNSYPWDDAKYVKRIKRLLFMYYISFYTTDTFSNNNDRLVYLQELTKYVLLPSQNYPNSTRKTIISSIDTFNNNFEKIHNEYVFQNLIDKIRILILDNNLDLDKFHEFIKTIIENVDVLYKSLLDFNQYLSTSGNIEENKIYEGQFGGDYYHKYQKYKNKYKQLKKQDNKSY